MMLHGRPENVCAESAAVNLVLAVDSEPNLTGARIRLFCSDFTGTEPDLTVARVRLFLVRLRSLT